MIDKNYMIPLVYQKMSERGFFNSETYLWLNGLRWMTIDEIRGYEYDEYESKAIIPFARTGRGDKWVWVVNNENKEYCVGICKYPEVNGVYYAKNTEDAILGQIIDYVSDANFYLNEEEAECFQVNEAELKMQLEGWKNSFKGILKDEHIDVIDELSKLSLKHVKSKYGEWDALLTMEEQYEFIDKYIKFDMMDDEFEWYTE